MAGIVPNDTGARPPFLAMPYPLDEYFDGLPGDYGKIARKALRATRRERGIIDGIDLDAGEALIDERSEKLWGALTLDRDVSAAGRRALVRRVLERLERDGIIARRPAQARGPRNGPANGPRNGPTPTVVRFLKFREILWRETTGTAQETAHGSAQETAPARGPVLPAVLPAPPSSLRSEAARRRQERDDEPPRKQLEVLDLTLDRAPLPDPGPGPFERVVAHWFAAWERAGRGKHSALTQAEGATVKRLVRTLGADELVERMDRALRDPWFLERGDLMLFAKQREKFARPGRPAAATTGAAYGLDPAWLEGLGQRRAEAEAGWADLVQQVKRSAYPDALDRLLGEAREQFVARFERRAAVAGGA